jgi:hypothetical protein
VEGNVGELYLACIPYSSVHQTVARGPPVISDALPGGLQAVSEEKSLQKLYQTLNE